ncbi:MAG: hypothetical protein M1833_004211 [Piccolia ochrophora]|nr:MAG: hypothetical protein M1833_004211 [Piccolia ochrophora]
MERSTPGQPMFAGVLILYLFFLVDFTSLCSCSVLEPALFARSGPPSASGDSRAPELSTRPDTSPAGPRSRSYSLAHGDGVPRSELGGVRIHADCDGLYFHWVRTGLAQMRAIVNAAQHAARAADLVDDWLDQSEVDRAVQGSGPVILIRCTDWKKRCPQHRSAYVTLEESMPGDTEESTDVIVLCSTREVRRVNPEPCVGSPATTLADWHADTLLGKYSPGSVTMSIVLLDMFLRILYPDEARRNVRTASKCHELTEWTGNLIAPTLNNMNIVHLAGWAWFCGLANDPFYDGRNGVCLDKFRSWDPPLYY